MCGGEDEAADLVREDGEAKVAGEKDDDTWGPHVSDSERGAVIYPVHLEPRAFKSIREYMSPYTAAAGPKSSLHLFCGVLLRDEEL
jgi:hypothetical protein